MVISGGQPVAAAGSGAAATPSPVRGVGRSVDAVADLAVGGLRAVSPGGQSLIVANVDGTLLAYRDECASCGGTLHDGRCCPGARSPADTASERSSFPAPVARSTVIGSSSNRSHCCRSRAT